MGIESLRSAPSEVPRRRPTARAARLLLNRAGYGAIHTSDLPNGNASTDAQVVEIAEAQDRVVVTKDRDFRDGHLLTGSPRKLFIVATGNISNDALMRLFEVHLGAATSALGEADFVELREFLVVRPRRDRSPGRS